MKKVIGLYILQTSIILFFISTGVKKGASIPIVEHGHDPGAHLVHAADYANPLPQVLMLTAIVVGVATLGVALAIIEKIYREYGSTEESQILERID